MKGLIYRYGIGSGLIIVVYSVLTFIYFDDITKLSSQRFRLFELLGYLRYFILIFTLILALRSFKIAATEAITFRSLLKAGVKISLLIAIITGLMQMTYIWLNPGFFDTYGMMYLEQLRLSGASETDIKQTAEGMKNYSMMKTPWGNGIYYFFETAFIGNIISLALATILKPRND